MGKLLRTKVVGSFVINIIIFVLAIFIGKYIRLYVLNGYNFHPTATIMINYMKMNSNSIMADDSFFKFAMIYKKINFFNLKTFMQWEIYFTFLLNALFFVEFFKSKNVYANIELHKLIFLYLSVILLNTYVFGMSKEPAIYFAFLIMSICLGLGKGIFKRIYIKIFIISLVLIVMALVMKTYYFLTLVYCGFLYVLIKYKLSDSKYNYIKIIFLTAIIYICVIECLQRFMPEHYTKIINVAFEEYEQAATMIKPIFNGKSYWIMFINYIIKSFRLLFPFELIRLGPKYLPYIIFQIMLSVYIIGSINRVNKLKTDKMLSLIIYWAYLMTSAAFEPDFGSWVRHEIACFPIIYYLVYL